MHSEQSTRRQEVVKHAEKENRLDQFFGFYLDRIYADWADRPEQHVVTLLTRSPASPVARVLMANSPDLLGAGVKLQVIFAQLEPNDLMGDWSDLAVIAAESDIAQSVEIAKLARHGLLDAHEQLVLGVDMSWCGDAMRRDPLQRDTIEVYDPCCPETANQSRKCFEALWARSEMVKITSRNSQKKTGASDEDESSLPTARLEIVGSSDATSRQ